MSHVSAQIVLGIVIGSGVSAILLSLGERLRRLLRLPAPPGLRAAAAFLLGSLALGLATLAVGLAGWFRPAPLLVLAALLACAGRWRALPRLISGSGAFAVLAIPLLPLAVSPPFFYDAWVYHLGLPWQALQEGVLRGHPENLFSAFPPLAQLVYALPLAAGADRAAGWIHLCGYLTASAAVASIAKRLGASHLASTLAGGSILYLPTGVLVPAFPAAEAWSVAAIPLAVGLALAARPILPAAVIAGLAVGIGCAARLQVVPWAVLVGLVLVGRFSMSVPRLSPRLFPRALVAYSVSVAAGSSPWWLKNGLLLGDPFAPIGWKRAGIETLWRDASSHLYLATGWGNLLARAFRAMAADPLSALLLAVGLTAFWMRRRTPALLVLGAGAAGWSAWALTGPCDRFLAPSLALLVAAAAATGRRGLGRWISIAVIGGVLVWGAGKSWALMSRIGGLSVVGEAREVYSSTVVSDPSPAFRACAGLPSGARLLLVCEPRGFPLPRAFETSSPYDRPGLAEMLEREASPERVAEELRSRGFTHLLVNVAEMRRLGATYPVLPWSSGEGKRRFVALTRLLGKPVVLERDVVVYSLEGEKRKPEDSTRSEGDRPRGGDSGSDPPSPAPGRAAHSYRRAATGSSRLARTAG